MPPEYATRRNHHGDNWLLEEISPALLLCTPGEPYTLLPPAVLIQAGDIRLDLEVEGSVWEPIQLGEDGLYTPRGGVAYARVEPPEMYRLAGGGHVVGWGDLYWDGAGLGQWQDVSAGGVGTGLFGLEAGEVCARAAGEGRQLFVATPDGALADHRVKPVPGRHRPLFVGEKVRRGDRILVRGLRDWQEVGEGLRGWIVAAGNEQNGWVRYCRPVAAEAQAWYVGEGREGDGQALGSAVDPFPSVEVAQARLEELENPQGIVWSLGGQPLVVYDLPEPAGR